MKNKSTTIIFLSFLFLVFLQSCKDKKGKGHFEIINTYKNEFELDNIDLLSKNRNIFFYNYVYFITGDDENGSKSDFKPVDIRLTLTPKIINSNENTLFSMKVTKYNSSESGGGTSHSTSYYSNLKLTNILNKKPYFIKGIGHDNLKFHDPRIYEFEGRDGSDQIIKISFNLQSLEIFNTINYESSKTTIVNGKLKIGGFNHDLDIIYTLTPTQEVLRTQTKWVKDN